MDCSNVKKRLSEYADGMLPEAEASKVKDHLGRCPDCWVAYESMTRIIEHMNRMESIDEPEGFLESVNARLERRFSLSVIFRRFFVPLRIKLPLELAGVAAAALLVLYLSEIKDHPNLYEITLSTKERADRIDTESIQIEAPERSVGDERKGPEPAAEWGESKVQVINGKSDKKGEKGVSLEEKVHANGGRSEEVAIEITEFDKFEEKAKRAETETAPLQAVVDSLGGQVISTEYREGTEIALSVTVEIRADRYQDLLQGLGRLGEIQTTSPEKPKDSSEIIRVKITFQYSSP